MTGMTSVIPVIIPSYEPDERLISLLEDFRSQGIRDVIIVNDGSGDRYDEIFGRVRAILDETGGTLLSHDVNRGKGRALKTGFSYVLKHYPSAVGVVTADSDGQHMPEYIPVMAKAMESEGADVVIASRNLAGGGAEGARGAGAKLITGFIRQTTGATITDPTSGMRMYNRAMVEKLARGFDLAPEPDTIALFIRRGAKVVEVPAKMRERQGGTSYLHFMSSIAYMARTCLSILLFQWFR